MQSYYTAFKTEMLTYSGGIFVAQITVWAFRFCHIARLETKLTSDPNTLFLRRSKRYGYCADDVPTITDLFTAADESLFKRVLRNELHVLQPLLY